MPAPWIGLTDVEELDVVEFRRLGIKKARRLFNWMTVAALFFVCASVYFTIVEREFRVFSFAAPLFLGLHAVLARRQLTRLSEMTLRRREKKLYSDRVLDTEYDDQGPLLNKAKSLAWKDLSSVAVQDGWIYLQFGNSPLYWPVRLATSMFPTEATREEFLQFIRGIIVRQGKTPKPQYIDRTVDPMLD